VILAYSVAFGRIAGNDFINLDDPGYVTDNHIVQSGLNLQNMKWVFTTVVLANWHPLTMISYMLEWNLFDANPTGYDIVSLILHIGAVIFL
jgi:protein O-mannosyl-transferase